MNTSIIRGLAKFGLIATLGTLSLMAQGPIRFNVPFDFTAQSKYFPAGEYSVVRVTPDALQIRGGNSHSTMVVLGHYGQPSKVPGVATMRFHRYDTRYFLSEV